MTTIEDLQSQIDALTAIVERQDEQFTKYVGPLLAGLTRFEESDSVLTGEPLDVHYVARDGGMYAYGVRLGYRHRERQAEVAAVHAQIDAGLLLR